jgi:arylsulfatase
MRFGRRILMGASARRLLAGCALLAFTGPLVWAQQIKGTPGSPDATTTITGKQLPPPDPKFGGVIKENLAQSKPWWAPRVVPPQGAPNILLIITDDVGFDVAFGGKADAEPYVMSAFDP